jgi:DNA-directed RNA polymerase specialized sigma24 family protein
LLIANKLSNRPNFINYPFKEEMISDGIENCLMYIDNFDPGKSSNPFAYITQIIYFAFIRRITKEKKHLYTKHKLIERSMIHNELATQSEYNEQVDQTFFENEHMNDFVRAFEETVIKKKKKKVTGIEQFIEEDLHVLEEEIVNDSDSIDN